MIDGTAVHPLQLSAREGRASIAWLERAEPGVAAREKPKPSLAVSGRAIEARPHFYLVSKVLGMFPDNILFSPGEPAGAPAAPSTPASAEPAAAPSSQTPSAPSGTPQVSPAPAAEGAAGTSSPAAPSSPSWLDGLRKAGWSGTETDEQKIIQQLVQADRDAAQLRPIAPYATQYMQHAEAFQRWRQEQQRQQTPPQQDWTAQLGWNPPPWDPNWRHQVTQDAQGNLVAVPGASPDVVPKYRAYQEFRTQQIDKFLENPHKYIAPTVQMIATQIAQQYSQQNVGQYRETVGAQQFVAQNSPWLYEQDGQGGIKQTQVINPQTGRYEFTKVLSPHGMMFRDKVMEYAQMGLPVEQQSALALRDVQLAYAVSQLNVQQQQANGQQQAQPANGQPATPRQAANAAFLQANNPAGRRPGGNANPAPTPVTRQNFEQVLLQRMKDAGVSAA